MNQDVAIVTYSYAEDLFDPRGEPWHVTAYFDKVNPGEADEEVTNEEFTVDDEWVSYQDLVDRFGEEATAEFLQRAQERAEP